MKPTGSMHFNKKYNRMKRVIGLIGLFMTFALVSVNAQQYALIDNYILNRIPAFESANKQLESLSTKWQRRPTRSKRGRRDVQAVPGRPLFPGRRGEDEALKMRSWLKRTRYRSYATATWQGRLFSQQEADRLFKTPFTRR